MGQELIFQGQWREEESYAVAVAIFFFFFYFQKKTLLHFSLCKAEDFFKVVAETLILI